MKLRIMTFNIQHGADHRHRLGGGGERIDLALMASEIEQCGADLCGLNEVRGRGITEGYTAQAEEIAARLGYHGIFGRSIYVHGTEPYGNALVSRFPLRKAEVIPIPDQTEPEPGAYPESRSILRCEIDVGGGLAVYVSHFGLGTGERRHAAVLAHRLLREETLPAVLMGDFNMKPNDVLLAPLFRDFTAVDPCTYGKSNLTFPSHAPDRQIDYIFTSNGVTVSGCGVSEAVVSGHRALWADVEIG